MIVDDLFPCTQKRGMDPVTAALNGKSRLLSLYVVQLLLSSRILANSIDICLYVTYYSVNFDGRQGNGNPYFRRLRIIVDKGKARWSCGRSSLKRLFISSRLAHSVTTLCSFLMEG